MKSFTILLAILLTACSSTGGTYSSSNTYENQKIQSSKPIVINIENYINLPPKYMNLLDKYIRDELSAKNDTVPMSVIFRKDSVFQNYTLGSISPNRKISISKDAAVNNFMFSRVREQSLASGFLTMVEDHQSFENYDLTILISFKNSTEEKNALASLLSAITIFAIPNVREHTMTVFARYFEGTKEIGQFEKTVSYDFSYSWGSDAKNNLHTMHAKNLSAGVVQNLQEILQARN